MWHAGSDLDPLQWEHRVLTTGSSEKSLRVFSESTLTDRLSNNLGILAKLLRKMDRDQCWLGAGTCVQTLP